jgi:PAS domain S-box-containing protein
MRNPGSPERLRQDGACNEFLDLFEDAPVGYVTLAPTGEVARANARAREILGLAPGTIQEMVFSDLVLPEDRELYFHRVRDIRSGDPLRAFELRLQGPEKTPVCVRLQISPRFDLHGRLRHLRIVFFDITEQKRLEAELRDRREELLLASEAGGIGIWNYDLKEGKTYWNGQLYRLLGLAPRSGPEALDAFFEFIHPEDRQGPLRDTEAIVARGDAFEMEFRVLRAGDGVVRWLATRGRVERDDAGRPLRIRGVNWDITERKAHELSLKESGERFLAVLEHSLDASFRRDLRAERYDYLSPVIEKITGYPPEEMIGMTGAELLALVHPDDRSRVATEVEQAFRAGYGKIEFRFRRKNGAYIWIGDVFTVQKDADGRPRYRTGVARDITDRKRIQRAVVEQGKILAKKLHELERSNAELSEYAYVVSHDLKAPLRAVRNYADFLAEDLGDTLGDAQRECLEGLQKAVSQGEALIRDLLTFSRIGQGLEDAVPIALQALVREACETLRISAEGGQVTVSADCPNRLKASPTLLKVILINLISNGLKFNRSDARKVDIECRPCPDDWVELVVRDNGIGIEERCREQIFRVFQRLHTSSAYHGTGIGLAIVKKAAAKMGGTVRLESTPGEGSTFIVRLPGKPAGSS